MLANSRNLGSKLSLCLALVALAGPVEANSHFTLLPLNTKAIAINDNGVVVGKEKDGTAFVRTPDGKMTIFKVGAIDVAHPGNTFPTGINNSGVVTGYYYDGRSWAHGFVRAADGAITIFDDPNAHHFFGSGTFPKSINAEGVIAGSYDGSGAPAHGFVRAADGTFTSFDVYDSFQTYPLGLNDKGDVVGFWFGAIQRVFIRSARGEITKFDAPNSVSTTPTAINAKGTVTGFYTDNVNYWEHAFVRRRDGTFATFDAPGPNAVPPTLALAINADGVVAGWGWPDEGHGEPGGFARDRNGHVHAIRLPNTDITAQGINNDGVVVGTLGQGDKYYGFIWTP